MDKDKQLEKIIQYIHSMFADDATGHDFFHMQRVAALAKKIAKNENANVYYTEVIAWLHDACDHKLFADTADAEMGLCEFLASIDFTDGEIAMLMKAVGDISFSKGGIPVSLEGKIVQDADRLDAIGAIGIARTFAYGGAKGQLMHHDNNKQNTSIQHFYDKLLHLQEQMHTQTAKRIAKGRHEFMKDFLEQFLKEWKMK